MGEPLSGVGGVTTQYGGRARGGMTRRIEEREERNKTNRLGQGVIWCNLGQGPPVWSDVAGALGSPHIRLRFGLNMMGIGLAGLLGSI